MKQLFKGKGWKYGALPVLLLLLLVLVLPGCGAGSRSAIVEGKVNVVTTFYPIYEFAKEIGGDDAHIINLLPTGVEPHDWTPRSQDIANTSKAQLFLYNGAGLEGWVPNFLKGLSGDSWVQAVEVSRGIELITSGEDDGHDHESGEAEDAAHTGTDTLHTDPHTWVSPKSALIMAANIKDSLIKADPAHRGGYEQRYQVLESKLKALDAEFASTLSGLPKKEIVVSHQAFGYLCRDYGLTQHAIMGLSPDAEPRAQDLVKLAKKVKAEKIRYIFFEELVSDRLAKTLAGEAGVKTLVLNPVEGLTDKQKKNGDTYFTLMSSNLQNLVLALQ
ncbi:zinc ABC transporter substrate-binding protein [Paenibacillus spiritus]|uniref:Zinc ABC transporter substrate-binding protein n=2 Tax=Paenibacillus spiritus TaxID=2496557 RepID=A0A5J5GHE9_9BACL|nr:metal ABC transporter substrate-binding protein [Paenibacillus spiritus]KAA9007507.1 zinc ABC transporter substrate-binding protein [Paenibacillus spiritus]